MRANLHLSGDLAAAIEARPVSPHTGRPGPASTVKRDLERYYQILTEDLASLRLTEAEAKLICDACNGSMWCEGGLHPRTHVAANVEDSITLNNLGSKWGIGEHEEHQLVERLRGMTSGQAFALVDAVERFWSGETATVQSIGMVR